MSETIRKHREAVFPALATYYEEPLARGEGMSGWDEEGRCCLVHNQATTFERCGSTG